MMYDLEDCERFSKNETVDFIKSDGTDYKEYSIREDESRILLKLINLKISTTYMFLKIALKIVSKSTRLLRTSR